MIEIEDIKRIELKPDDKIVVRYDGYIPDKEAAELRQRLMDFFPGHSFIILHKKFNIEILCEAKE